MINLAKASNTLINRGPDHIGAAVYEYAGFGHRRLAVIDTTSGANQPMKDPSGRYTIVFNGEIFNYKILRDQLIQKGIEFKTSSDTEVVLMMYITYGVDCFSMFNGFFAFSIYDLEQHSMVLVRDRYGIKPLLYSADTDKVVFGSEMKTILCYNIPREIDQTSLYQYLQLNYIPDPYTIIKGVQKLEPGHYLQVGKHSVSKHQWYQVPTHEQNPFKGNYEDACSQLVQTLDAAVERRLVSDVPLGSFLSGGIDSSVIAGLASRHTEKLKTFSIGYADEPFFDETHYAELVAKKFNTEHTSFKLTNKNLYDHLFTALDYLDEPFADSSALAVNILSHHTRKEVTVALSGDGADEIFTGYHKHMAEWRVRNAGAAEQVIAALGPLWSLLPSSRNSSLTNRFRQFGKFAEGYKLSPKERYYQWACITPPSDARNLLVSSLLDNEVMLEFERRKNHIVSPIKNNGGDINDVLLADVGLVLPSDMLHKVDMMSMANSLEVRVPFLDVEVVNFAFSLPESFKINKNMKKRIVQDAFRDMLPSELYNRPKKGFEVPLLKWLRGDLKHLIVNDLLKDSFIEEQQIFNPTAIKQLKNQLFSSNPGDAHAKIWALIVFQWWWKKYIK